MLFQRLFNQPIFNQEGFGYIGWFFLFRAINLPV